MFRFFKNNIVFFFQYIINAKTRLRLLLIAVIGLAISSFALLVIQSTMKGLQSNVISRSQTILGVGSIYFKKEVEEDRLTDFLKELKSNNILFWKEYEIELLVSHSNYLSPVILHGIDDSNSPFPLSSEKINNLILPYSIFYKMDLSLDSKVSFMSPVHLSSSLVDIPKVYTANLDKVVTSEVPEVDEFHAWIRLRFVQNLIRKKVLNKVRFFSEVSEGFLSLLMNKYDIDGEYRTWESENSELVWSLKLETTIMMLLFSIMTVMVSLAVISGLFNFFHKIKPTLTSFWILGMSQASINIKMSSFIFFTSFLSSLLGIVFGLIFLTLIDHYNIMLLPDIFVDRKIPIKLDWTSVLISFSVPFFVSMFFSFLTLKQFKNDLKFLELIRMS